MREGKRLLVHPDRQRVRERRKKGKKSARDIRRDTEWPDRPRQSNVVIRALIPRGKEAR